MVQLFGFPDFVEKFAASSCEVPDPDDLTFKETLRVLTIYHFVLFIVMYVLPLFVTIIVYFLICRKLWLRKSHGNVTDTNHAATKKSKCKVVR